MNKTRVLVVDDHPLMREAICAAIGIEPDMEIVGEAGDGLAAVEQARQLQPDITIMDLFLPGQDGVAAIGQIIQENPGARILALTSSTDDRKVIEAVEAGVAGYLVKDSRRDELLLAIREVRRGNAYLPPSVARKLMEGMRSRKDIGTMQQRQPIPPVTPTPEPLTGREHEVLLLLGQGVSNAHIAQTLGISRGTVRVHVHNILGKLGLESRSQAIVYAMHAGLASPAAVPPGRPDRE